MKRYKRILILLAVLVVCCAVTFGVSRYQEEQEKIASTDEVVLTIDPETVTALSWDYGEESFAFHREDSWLYDDDEAFPVDADTMEELLSTFESFGVAFVIEDVEDYDQYGLEEPTCTIHIDTDDASYEILLGAFSTMDQQRYVSIGDGKVYLAASDPMEVYEKELSDLIDNDEVPVFDLAEQLTFSGAADYAISYQEENDVSYSDEDVYTTTVDGKTIPLDSSLVDSYLSTVQGLDLTNYVNYKATEEDLETYGLAEPELQFEMDYVTLDENGDEQDGSFLLSVSRDPEEKAAEEAEAEAEAEAAEETDEAETDEEEETFTAYARVGESPIVYQITEAEYNDLMACTADDLRHQEIFPCDFDQVTALEITLEGETYVITSEVTEDEETDEEVRTYYFQEEPLEVETLSEALTALTADSFTEKSADGQEEIRLTLTLSNDHYPTMELAFYRYDGTKCLAEVDGATLALVPRSQVMALVEAVQAFVLN